MNRTARIKLSPRLQMVADMVREGVAVADIGTDHAYIPVYLLQNGVAPCAVAADLKKGPLANAQAAVLLYGLEEKISLRLSDGLDSIGAEEAQDIILAGMGGILIAELLERAAWIKDNSKHLVLQPMTHAEDVRRFLLNNGFEILFENACFEGNRCYVCVCAQYKGAVETPKRISPSYEYIGELGGCDNDAAREYVLRLNLRLKKKAAALEKAGSNREAVKKLKDIICDISEVSHDQPR